MAGSGMPPDKFAALFKSVAMISSGLKTLLSRHCSGLALHLHTIGHSAAASHMLDSLQAPSSYEREPKTSSIDVSQQSNRKSGRKRGRDS
jgi:hypothetical protein